MAGFVAMAKAELGPARVVVEHRLDYSKLTPEDAIILVHPVGDLDLPSLSRFLHAGGRVVLLDDFGDGDLLLSHFGMTRRPLGEPTQVLGNRLYLPIAKPSSYHPTVADVDHVILNHASCIDHPDLSSVLEVEVRTGEKKAVAVAGAVDKGRLLAVADSSVFVDAMLRFPGNATFARAVIRYAVEDDVWGKRGGRLYILSEGITQTGVYGESSAVSAFFEEATRGVREALQKLRDEGLGGAPALGLAVLAAVGCVSWVAKRAAKPHAPQIPRFLIPLTALGRGGQTGHVSTLTAKGHAARARPPRAQGSLRGEAGGVARSARRAADGRAASCAAAAAARALRAAAHARCDLDSAGRAEAALFSSGAGRNLVTVARPRSRRQ